MELFNTLTKNTSTFTPINKGIVNIYTCGPTVYDHAHIGNLSSYIYADTLHRVLEINGYKVTHVMNITDVDDKTIRKSKEINHKQEPMEGLISFTNKYTEAFFEDMGSVGNNMKSYDFVKATDHIEHMQILIKSLVDSGVAYISDDGVYFSIDKYKKSGKVYGQLLNLNSSENSESRIDNDEYDKETARDFALWKKRKGDEPYWGFEIEGKQLDGRPGWHIECSAMSAATLSLPFDIHTGGIDLIFPHHENEIAQSTAGITNNVMANCFFHNEHLLVDNKKMSKSLSNFYTLNDIRGKNIDVLAFRLLVLQSHYRSQSNFTWESLISAQSILEDIRSWSDLRFQNLQSKQLEDEYSNILPSIIESLNRDLNTPEALSQLILMVKRTGEIGADSTAIAESVTIIDQLFGFNLTKRQDISEFEKETIKQRALSRYNKNWELSDTIREELKSKGIDIKDTEQGQTWSRISN